MNARPMTSKRDGKNRGVFLRISYNGETVVGRKKTFRVFGGASHDRRCATRLLRLSSVDWPRCRANAAQYVARTPARASVPRVRTTGAAVGASRHPCVPRPSSSSSSLCGSPKDGRRESAATGRAERRRASNVATRFLTPLGGHVRVPSSPIRTHVRTSTRRRRRRRRLRTCARDARHRQRWRKRQREGGGSGAHAWPTGTLRDCWYTPGCLTESSQIADRRRHFGILYVSDDSSLAPRGG